MRPAAHSLSFASPKESKQRKGDPAVCVPFAALRGNLRCSRAGCAAELTARCALRSNSCGKPDNEACVSFGTQATPPAALLGAYRRELNSQQPTRAIAALGLGRGASACAKGRAQRWPVWLPHSRVDAPVSGRAWGERVRRRTHTHRCLARRGCLNVAAKQRSEFRGASHALHDTGCPARRRRKGSQTVGSPFFWVLFFGEAKNKYLARRDETRPRETNAEQNPKRLKLKPHSPNHPLPHIPNPRRPPGSVRHSQPHLRLAPPRKPSHLYR